MQRCVPTWIAVVVVALAGAAGSAAAAPGGTDGADGPAGQPDGDHAAGVRLDDHVHVALAGELGAAGGGGATPGGLRVAGRLLYRLTDRDWFDGGLAFTYGVPVAGCGRVPPDAMTCEHGVTEGFAGDLSLGVRRHLRARAGFAPFVRAGLFGRVLRFAGDDVSGIGVGVEVGAGVRAALGRRLAVVGAVGVEAGRAWLGHDLGARRQLGMTVTGGAEWLLP